MNELERVLAGDSAAAPPVEILEAIDLELAHRKIAGSPRTIYEELWHIAFWQRVSLEWAAGSETPYPEHSALGFPTERDVARESWGDLCRRFFADNASAAALTRDAAGLERAIRCPSPPGKPVRTMTMREQLESLAAHNAYHSGRIVLLRQLSGAWPPPSGGNSWGTRCSTSTQFLKKRDQETPV